MLIPFAGSQTGSGWFKGDLRRVRVEIVEIHGEGLRGRDPRQTPRGRVESPPVDDDISAGCLLPGCGEDQLPVCEAVRQQHRDFFPLQTQSSSRSTVNGACRRGIRK